MFKDIGQGYAIDNAHGDLADDPGSDDFVGNPFRQR